VARGVYDIIILYKYTYSVILCEEGIKKLPRTLGDERGSRFVYKNKNRYRMERNLRVWDDDDDDDSRKASSKVDGGGGGDHVTGRFSTSGSGALRNGDAGGGGGGGKRTIARAFFE